MSLYDDDDTVTDKTAASGWASGIKMMQNQLAFKKATITAPKREMLKKRGPDKLPPVIDLKSRKEEEENTPPYFSNSPHAENSRPPQRDPLDTEWKFINEYDPFWPNDYEKVVKEMREKRDREDEKRRQERDEREKKRRDREDSSTGFSRTRDLEEEEDERDRPPRRSNRGVGAAIAPPPSLDESPVDSLIHQPSKSSSYGGVGGSVAAKIMAKYGFKEGQGLGKSQQGIVKALEVEKTSKRGGRIVTDEGGSLSPPPPSFSAMPPPPMLPPSFNKLGQFAQDKQESSISDILKKPSKVIMLLNMVGPGEVDDDLEPEVREECSSKYGNVSQVVIFEIPKAIPEEAVRIFVEFQRVEAAIKAVIDLNGRFFGGRQVKAGFYDSEDFRMYKLNEFVQF